MKSGPSCLFLGHSQAESQIVFLTLKKGFQWRYFITVPFLRTYWAASVGEQRGCGERAGSAESRSLEELAVSGVGVGTVQGSWYIGKGCWVEMKPWWGRSGRVIQKQDLLFIMENMLLYDGSIWNSCGASPYPQLQNFFLKNKTKHICTLLADREHMHQVKTSFNSDF